MQHRRGLLLCLIVILTLCVAFSAGAEESSPSITVGVEESTPSVVNADEVFTVNVTISNSEGIKTFIFSLDYDTENLIYVGYENGEVFDDTVNVVVCKETNGAIKYQYIGTPAEVEEGIVVSLEFKANKTLNPRQSFKIEQNSIGVQIVGSQGDSFAGGAFGSAFGGDVEIPVVGNPPVNEDGEIEMHTCTYSASSEVVDPTCTAAGYTDYICSCGEIYTVENVDAPALGHTEEEIPAVAPTCTETGLTAGKKCSVCDEVLEAPETVAALGHTEEEIPAVAPTCTETGLTAGKKCSVCDEVLEAPETVAALGHTEEEIPAVAPTCTATGLTAGKKCTVCDEITVAPETVAALGHTEEEIPAVAPTCTATGLTAGKKCSVCDEVLVAPETVAALGHKEEEIPAVDPTYSETGLTAGKKCTVCGEVLVTPETVAKKSAAWIWITVSASVVVLGGGAALLVMKKKNLWIFANK